MHHCDRLATVQGRDHPPNQHFFSH